MEEVDTEEQAMEAEYDRMKREAGMTPTLNEKIELKLTPEAIEKMAEMGEKESPLEEVFGTEEATAKALVELVKTEKIDLLTEFNYDELQAITIAEGFGDFIMQLCGSTMILDMCHSFKSKKVSFNRKGRTEIVGLGTFIGGLAEEKRGKMSLIGGLR